MLEGQSADKLGRMATGRFYWVIVVDEAAGGYLQLDVSPGYRQHDMATLGYTVDEALQGRGVATEAVGAAVRIAFGAGGLGLERIEAVAAVENVASRRVLEKAGFQFEGIRRGLLRIQGQRVDHACYGLLVTDFSSKES
jgi:RimJ/RimL family protein N-acetyltransferase